MSELKCKKCGHIITDLRVRKGDSDYCNLRCRCRAVVGVHQFINPILPTALLSKEQIGDIKNWIAQPKIDGWRLVVFHNGWGRLPLIYTRQGFELTHWKGLQGIRAEFNTMPIGVYDCELWINGGTEKDIPQLKDGSIAGARVTIFDLIVDKLSLTERYTFLLEAIRRQKNGKHKVEFRFIDLIACYDLAELSKSNQEITIAALPKMVNNLKQEGYVGIILKKRNSIYPLSDDPKSREATNEDWIKVINIEKLL